VAEGVVTMTSIGAQDVRWVLWAGTVGFATSLDERFRAAADAGYHAVTLSPPDVVRAAEAGTSAEQIGRQARDLGLQLILDPVMNWYPDRTPSPSRFAGVAAKDALRMCEALGARSFSAIATGASDVPLAELPEFFGRLCDEAAAFGADAHLEFIPFTFVRDLRTAWDIVRIADRPNGGLVFDTWHFFRSDADFDLLATIPGKRILQVQIDDAAAVADGPLREETQRRLLPGDGALDLSRAVRALAAIGGMRWIGPEVINPELAAMPVLDAAELALARSRSAIARALSA
jgi:sugar phosphate isomerase/epimerase